MPAKKINVRSKLKTLGRSNKILSKKEKATLERKQRWQHLLKEGLAFCEKNQETMVEERYKRKKCYLGHHGTAYCQYFKELK